MTKETYMEAIKQSTIDAKLSEEEIIQRILRGEQELYEILVRRNNQKLYRVIRSYLQDANEIEDAMQNTYIKAFEKLAQFRATASFSTWLTRIGINEALARLKANKKRLSVLDQEHPFTIKISAQMEKNGAINPEERLFQSETKNLIESAIDRLLPKYRIVFVLKEVDGMSIKEIADCLDLTVSNVKIRLHRAKANLKEQLLQIASSAELFEFGASRCDRITEQVMARVF